MNHPFTPSGLDSSKCQTCKRESTDHTNRATCESCGSSGTCNLTRDDILICEDCWAKELGIDPPKYSGHYFVTPQNNSHIDSIRSENTSLRVQTDIFNSKIRSIQELKESIESDISVPSDQKNFTFARSIETRFNHLSEILQSAKNEIIQAENEQRALQITFNELAKKLRAEEREQIKLRDLTYQPKTVDVRNKRPRISQTKKFDKNEIRRLVKELNHPLVTEIMVQMVVVQRGCSPIDAIRLMKENFKI